MTHTNRRSFLSLAPLAAAATAVAAAAPAVAAAALAVVAGEVIQTIEHARWYLGWRLGHDTIRLLPWPAVNELQRCVAAHIGFGDDQMLDRESTGGAWAIEQYSYVTQRWECVRPLSDAEILDLARWLRVQHPEVLT